MALCGEDYGVWAICFLGLRTEVEVGEVHGIVLQVRSSALVGIFSCVLNG